MPNLAYGGPDERVRYALQVLELEYTPMDDGGFRVEFALGRGRTQIVFINSQTTRVGTLELRRVYACGFTGSEPLPPGINALLLASNNEAPIGSWATFDDSGELFLIFQTRVPADLDAASLREVLVTVAEYADQAEEQLSGDDAL